MALNKPKYTLFKNATYALKGFKDITLHESSFKLQLVSFVSLTILAWNLPLSFGLQAILSISLFIPLLAEITNSAIERVVDLVTLEYHEMAGRAKDVGATLVLISIVTTACIWAAVFYMGFLQGN